MFYFYVLLLFACGFFFLIWIFLIVCNSRTFFMSLASLYEFLILSRDKINTFRLPWAPVALLLTVELAGELFSWRLKAVIQCSSLAQREGKKREKRKHRVRWGRSIFSLCLPTFKLTNSCHTVKFKRWPLLNI